MMFAACLCVRVTLQDSDRPMLRDCAVCRDLAARHRP